MSIKISKSCDKVLKEKEFRLSRDTGRAKTPIRKTTGSQNTIVVTKVPAVKNLKNLKFLRE